MCVCVLISLFICWLTRHMWNTKYLIRKDIGYIHRAVEDIFLRHGAHSRCGAPNEEKILFSFACSFARSFVLWLEHRRAHILSNPIHNNMYFHSVFYFIFFFSFCFEHDSTMYSTLCDLIFEQHFYFDKKPNPNRSEQNCMHITHFLIHLVSSICYIANSCHVLKRGIAIDSSIFG